MASRELTIVVDSLKKFTGDTVKALVLEIHANLTRAASEGGTPRDTGFASANWVPSIGSPFTGLAGSRKSVSRSAAQRGLSEVAIRYRLKDGPAFVSNNVAYIQRLNAGHSAQAPSGFVQNAVADAVRAVDRAGV